MLAVASTVVLTFIEPRLAAVLAVGYTLLGWTMWKVKDLSADAVLAERTIDAEMNSVAEQYLAGAEDVASLGAGRHGLRRFGDAAASIQIAVDGSRVTLRGHAPPVWAFVNLPMNEASSTEIRAQGGWTPGR